MQESRATVCGLGTVEVWGAWVGATEFSFPYFGCRLLLCAYSLAAGFNLRMQDVAGDYYEAEGEE